MFDSRAAHFQVGQSLIASSQKPRIVGCPANVRCQRETHMKGQGKQVHRCLEQWQAMCCDFALGHDSTARKAAA